MLGMMLMIMLLTMLGMMLMLMLMRLVRPKSGLQQHQEDEVTK